MFDESFVLESVRILFAKIILLNEVQYYTLICHNHLFHVKQVSTGNFR